MAEATVGGAAISGQSLSGQSTGTQAVDRAAMLIATVVRSDEPVAFAELADACELPKSTTSRLLTALERTELVERTEDGGYVAGPLFWQYAARHDPFEELARLASPVLSAVGDLTGETVNLGIARGDRVAHIAQVDSRYLLGTRDWTQLEVPPHSSSLGKVLYAFGALPIPAGELERLTDVTLTNSRELAACLGVVRRQGYATTVNELEVGLTGVAAPVLGGRGETVAALGISGPTTRLGDQLEAHGKYLIEQATRLSALIAKPQPRVRTHKDGAA
jgi:IclR family transcriptional regulator, acetate operon repressor